MAINTFSDLKAALANWLARSDLAAYYEDIITLGEARLCQDLRLRETEETLSFTTNTPTVPTDFIELKHARVDISGGQALHMREADWIYLKYPNRNGEGIPQFVAIDGSSFIFGPAPAENYTIVGTYYKRPAELGVSQATNEWTSTVPDVLLFACLSESAGFLKDDPRISVWEAKYNNTMKSYRSSYRKQARRESRVSVA